MSNYIPLSVPTLRGNEWNYVNECLDMEWVSSAGKYVDLFEQKISEYTGAKYAVACVNGTSALQVSLLLAGVQPGDEVIVPTLTFIAPVNAIRYNGAEPVFMDADKYFNIDIEKTINFIFKETRFEKGFTINQSTNRRIFAIILVHVYGNAVNIEPLLDICKQRNITIIEDAAESLGTKYQNGRLAKKHTGTIGTLGCLSFNGNKIVTSGGGGMILTDDGDLAGKAGYLTTQAKDDPVRYVHHEIGYNFRLTNIQAALGAAQLEQLPRFLKKKKEIFKTYKEKIDLIPGLNVANVPEYADNNHWMVSIQIDNKQYGKDRDALAIYLANNNIQTRPVWYLNHLQKPYRNCQHYKIEKAVDLLAKTLNIPASVSISENQINFVVDNLSMQ